MNNNDDKTASIPPPFTPAPSCLAKGRYVLTTYRGTTIPTGKEDGTFEQKAELAQRVREYARLHLSRKGRYDERLKERIHSFLQERKLSGAFSAKEIVESMLDGYALRYGHIKEEDASPHAEELDPYIAELRKIGGEGEITWSTVGHLLLQMEADVREEEEEPPPPEDKPPPPPPTGKEEGLPSTTAAGEKAETEGEEGYPSPLPSPPPEPEMPRVPKKMRPSASTATMGAVLEELTDEELLEGGTSLTEKAKPLLNALDLRPPKQRVKPGVMTIRHHALKIPKALQRLRGRRYGYVGPFRYPYRALLPASDGRAFHTIQKYKGGTVLVDISGSMNPSLTSLLEVLLHAPTITVAFYHGGITAEGEYNLGVGILDIVARQGRMVEEDWLDKMQYLLGGNNIIDIPALRWLLRQPGPRIWVSDGLVTGCGDCADTIISLEARVLVKRGHVTRYPSFNAFVHAFTGAAKEQEE